MKTTIATIFSVMSLLGTVSASASQGWDLVNAQFDSAHEVTREELKATLNLNCAGLYNPVLIAPAYAGTVPFSASTTLTKEAETAFTLVMVEPNGVDHRQAMMLLPSGLASISQLVSRRAPPGSVLDYYQSKDVETHIRTNGGEFFVKSSLKRWFGAVTSNIFALVCSPK